MRHKKCLNHYLKEISVIFECFTKSKKLRRNIFDLTLARSLDNEKNHSYIVCTFFGFYHYQNLYFTLKYVTLLQF